MKKLLEILWINTKSIANGLLVGISFLLVTFGAKI
jgi:hypothetical protein